jgi:hypothetical protein
MLQPSRQPCLARKAFFLVDLAARRLQFCRLSQVAGVLIAKRTAIAEAEHRTARIFLDA